MARFRQPEQSRGQMVLCAQRLEDAIQLDHPARRFNELPHASLFAETFPDWQGGYVLTEGKPPYHPRDAAGLYVYGLLNRIRSSRQLEAACYKRLDVISPLQGQHPDHSTIAESVRRHGPRLRQPSRDVVQVGVRAQLVRLGQVPEDGTKVEADAGRNSVRSENRIASWLSHLDEKHVAPRAAPRAVAGLSFRGTSQPRPAWPRWLPGPRVGRVRLRSPPLVPGPAREVP